VLVVNDLLGLTLAAPPKFVRTYADLAGTMRVAFTQFRDDVRAGRYPDDRESYHWPAPMREQFEKVRI
jgi:3-methyl-2-oxobutanoate hydroxymethyltransferase